MDEILIPVVSIVGGIFIWYAIIRMYVRHGELQHAERLAMIEKGLPLPPEALQPHVSPKAAAANSLKMGIFWLASGLGLMAALRIAAAGTGRWAWGLVVVAIGLSDLFYWFAHGRAEWEEAKRIERETRELSSQGPTRLSSEPRNTRIE